jgi:triacylglycerol lipase
MATGVPLPHEIETASWDPVAPPPPAERRQWWGRHLAETRWLVELARLQVDPVFWNPPPRGVPRGNGEPVVLIPGFLAGDPSLLVLADWLARMGYETQHSGIAMNVGCSDRALDRLEARVGRIAQRTGRRVALIGHSRGGHFAKALAHRRPADISAVVTMGSGLDTPFDISIPTRAAVAAVRWVHDRTTDRAARNGCLTETCRCRFTADFCGEFPAGVPLTSIYSRGDGVVWWEACTVPYADNVEVTGSHVGLAFNAKAYRAIGEALAAAAAAARAAGAG